MSTDFSICFFKYHVINLRTFSLCDADERLDGCRKPVVGM